MNNNTEKIYQKMLAHANKNLPNYFLELEKADYCYREKQYTKERRLDAFIWNISNWMDTAFRCCGIFDDKDNQGENDNECIMLKNIFKEVLKNIDKVIAIQNGAQELNDFSIIGCVSVGMWNANEEIERVNGMHDYSWYGHSVDNFICAISELIEHNDSYKTLIKMMDNIKEQD